MTIKEAEAIVRRFDENNSNDREEEFMFLEALEYLVQERKRPEDMMYLGGIYYEKKRFDLALKYYEMAKAMDYEGAYECLGYIWYYGRTGERDYKKAYECFHRLMEKGDLVATYKIADMYRNGYFVEKDQQKYEEIIEDLYPKVAKCRDLYDPLPEVFTRLARIRKDQGRIEEAVELYLYAKDFLGQRIQYNAFFGNLNIMKWLIDDLYELIEFDETEFDFFDLYYLLRFPHRITFEYQGKTHQIESVMEGEACEVNFDGKWFRTRDDFFKDALIGSKKATAIHRDFYGFTVEE